MNKQRSRKRASMIFLMLGLVFLGLGLALDRSVFSWLAIVFVLLSLALGGRWLRPRR